jgi:hypothetical protein
MNDASGRPSPVPNSPAVNTADAKARGPFFVSASWRVAFFAAVFMVVLAILGVGLTTTNRRIAPTYWICLVPVYGLLCVGVAWNRTRRGEGSIGLVRRQIVHWLAVAVAVGLDFYVRDTGQETGMAAGFNALLLLSLGCFLAGVHLQWLFTLVGALLALTLVLVVKADQYLWLIVIAAAFAVVAMYWMMRSHGRFAEPKR